MRDNDRGAEVCVKIGVVVALALLTWAASVGAQEKQVITAPGAPPGLPFSSGVRVGDLLFLSGEIGRKPGALEIVPGGIEAETRQALENIKAVLEYAGSSLDRVVKCTVFLGDMRDYAAMNAVYASFFPKDPPARSTFGANGLALGAAVEIECLALAGAKR
jgi:reactive intermediate/imine deaminase